MKQQLSLLDLLRVWAALTGLLLVTGYFAALWLGIASAHLTMLPMLAAAIGGFELFLFAQDVWMKRRSHNG